ncbi:MAG: MetQ/NlpA family ABC transporter substrate-binding protein [Aerococcus sp.]|nr:MetQ/NlpA family ABC transporter substrate-binding protein [Aerococcus sp.]
MKRRHLFLPVIVLLLVLVGCSNSQKPKDDTGPQKFTIGASGDFDREIWEDVGKRLKPQGVDLEVKTFSDFIQPDIALDEGDIDANAFQYSSFLLDNAMNHDLDITAIGYAQITPVGIWAPKNKPLNSIDDLPQNAKVAIAKDPVNLNHELRIIQDIGLVTLTPDEGQQYTLEDVTNNPKNLEFEAIDSSSMMSFIDDVDIFITWASVAGLSNYEPDDAIFIEDPKTLSNDFKLVFAVRDEDKDNPLVSKVLKEYQTDATAKAMKRITNGKFTPGWDKDNLEHDNQTAYNYYQKLKQEAAKKNN